MLDGAPHAGHRFPQGAVPADGCEAWFDDVHGAGWRLVTVDDPGGIESPDLDWFAAHGGTVVGVGGFETYRRWFTGHDTRWALQRPDFHLYGTARSPAEAAGLLAHLRTDLAGVRSTQEHHR